MLAAQRGAHAVGVDISERAIGIARRKAAERGSDASFQVLDALRLRSLGETFDAVIDSGLFHVFDDADRARYVREVQAVLRPGGHLHLMCFSDHQPGEWGPRRVSEEELRRAFDRGWRVDSIAADSFEINPVFESTSAEAWLVDVVRAASR